MAYLSNTEVLVLAFLESSTLTFQGAVVDYSPNRNDNGFPVYIRCPDLLSIVVLLVGGFIFSARYMLFQIFLVFTVTDGMPAVTLQV